MDKLLTILEGHGRYTLEELAAMLDEDPSAIGARIDKYREEGVIRGTRTLIDWEKVGGNGVQALIEVHVSPQKGHGYDEVAAVIANMREVSDLMLMSGGYDLSVIINAPTFQEIAMFVARQLAPIEGVLSTATHFVLRTYKKDGAVFTNPVEDERECARF